MLDLTDEVVERNSFHAQRASAADSPAADDAQSCAVFPAQLRPLGRGQKSMAYGVHGATVAAMVAAAASAEATASAA
jgi:hypothetical protein